jgi:hypothetical protein
MGFDLRVREAADPAAHHLELSAVRHRRPGAGDQLSRNADITSGPRVRDRGSKQALVPAQSRPPYLSAT